MTEDITTSRVSVGEVYMFKLPANETVVGRLKSSVLGQGNERIYTLTRPHIVIIQPSGRGQASVNLAPFGYPLFSPPLECQLASRNALLIEKAPKEIADIYVSAVLSNKSPVILGG